MKKTACLLLISLPLVIYAQNVGIGISAPKARLHVADSSVVFTGPASLPGTPGNTPVSGAGNRMMWYADKAAFRAGGIDNTDWDKNLIGIYSFATGFSNRASGPYSAVFGLNSIASGDNSFAFGNSVSAFNHNSFASGYRSVAFGSASIAMGDSARANGVWSYASGYRTVASNTASIAMGYLSEASGQVSLAIGVGARASGNYGIALGNQTEAEGNFSAAIGYIAKTKGYASTALGYNTHSHSYGAFVAGVFNDSIVGSNALNWIATDPVFMIGNGTAHNARSNAIMILKNGNVGIGTNTPVNKLQLVGGTDATFTSNSGFLTIGNTGGTNIVFDNNEILSRNNGGDSPLYINTSGGDVILNYLGSGKVGIGTSTPDEKVTIGSGNIRLWNSAKGIILDAVDRPLITRGFDAFTSGNYTGLGRWGIFMEPSNLTFGVPNLAGKAFQFAAYETNSTPTNVLAIDNTGKLTRPATNTIDLLPVAFGFINASSGTATVLNGTGNFTVERVSAGKFLITITGHTFSFLYYTAYVTPFNHLADTFMVFANVKDEAPGNLLINIKTSAGAYIDMPFSFIVYKAI